MNNRRLGKTDVMVSEISLGTWQLGGKWGAPFDKEEALKTLQTAVDYHINCFDTADVYQGGLSEKTIGEFIKPLEHKPFVITKAGRRLNPHVKEGFNEANIRKFIDDSRENMQVETLDMVLLHCPPTDVYYMPELFKVLDELIEEQKINHYGVSVERIEEGLKALEYPNVSAIEIIFNMFRLRPMETFFKKAKEKDVGIIVRVPLASGLLTGKFTKDTTFNKDDHRTFNRDGAAFDKGETFSGVDYELGLTAVEKLKGLFDTKNLVPYALKYCLMFDAVSTVIPGASNAKQVISNAEASLFRALTEEEMDAVKDIYDAYIKDPVHYLW
ncbi:aldo/keto reductase [Liberiplasma polymorphum]|uniref:aldo/keto reductase n=1 Tax=Liberiplasma polymorphum TaxID=3374570 RepID=UPI003775767E